MTDGTSSPSNGKEKGRPTPTPVSSMRSFWGLMRAYWLSEQWQAAWGLTAIIVALTAFSAMASVWFAEASGELVNAIALLHHPLTPTYPASLLTSAATLVVIVVVKDVGFTSVRHYFSATLHRKWRAWLDQRFNEALIDRNHSHYHMQRGASETPIAAIPDNIDQRIQESIKGMTGGAIGLAMGIAGVVLSFAFVGSRVVATSTQVDGLEFLGEYGTACLTVVAILAYVPINTLVAVKLGGMLQRLSSRMQSVEGSYRGGLNTLLHHSFQVAAADGEPAQLVIHRRRYLEIDRTWEKLNRLTASYMGFELVYNFLGSRIVAYAPGLLPYVQNRIDLQSYVTGAELTNALIADCSWFIHVMPDIATLRANAGRVCEVAQAIEDVRQPRDFYARTGHVEFRYERRDPQLGLAIQDLELMHAGADEPFVRTGKLSFRPREWTLLCGESGSGKSSLFKALNGLWPHGRGRIVLPDAVRILYATQEVWLPQLTLKELVCLPDPVEDHSDEEVAAALAKADLAEFSGDLDEEGRGEQRWDQLLSGGQKQKVVLARILLLRPGLLFLDEPTSALDRDAAVSFHQAIKDACPDVILISIMHDAMPPRTATGGEFFESVLAIQDGEIAKHPLFPAAKGPVGPARVAPRAAREAK